MRRAGGINIFVYRHPMAGRSTSISQALVASATTMAMLFFLKDVLVPLVLAVVLAVLVNALVQFIAGRLPTAPHWAVLALAALVVLSCTVTSTFIIAQGAAEIGNDGPALIVRIEEIVQESGRAIGLRQPLHLSILTGQINIPRLAAVMAGAVGEFLSGFLLMITYFGFILAGHRNARRKLAKISAAAGRITELEDTLVRISNDIETYVWVQTVTGIMIALASALVMFAVGLDNLLFWAVVLFLLSYIPVIGVTVGSVLPSLFALLQFPSWWQPAVVFGGIQLISFIIGHLVYPKMQAESQNIDPVVTLLALAIWGFLWGIAGAFLAVPLTLIFMMICSHFPQTRLVAVLLSNDGQLKLSATDSSLRKRNTWEKRA